MSTKTYCDRCGTECVNYTLNLYGNARHTTSQGEQVAYDEVKPVELCLGCEQGLAGYLGPAFRISHDSDSSEPADYQYHGHGYVLSADKPVEVTQVVDGEVRSAPARRAVG